MGRALAYGDNRQDPSEKEDGSGVLTDIVDGSVWHKHMKDNKGPGNRIIGLACGIDGFQPFKGKHTSPTCLMPAKLTCLNLPPTIRNEVTAQWVPFIFEGKKEPDPLFGIEILAQDLLYAEHFGLQIAADASDPSVTDFNCKVKLLQVKCDTRGYMKVFRRTGTPAKVGACYTCDIEGLPPKDSKMSKVVYPGESHTRNEA